MTERQREIITIIKRCQKLGYTPSTSDIAAECLVSRQAILQQLLKMHADGYIEYIKAGRIKIIRED